MSQKVIKGTEKLSEAIRSRRHELGLTIEEAASRAGIGTKTWCRYEAGESIRQDKAKGVCKALNWRVFPEADGEMDSEFDMDEYKQHEAWSEFINENFGTAAAISFVLGSDLLLDDIEEDLSELARRPKGTHLGELDMSMLSCMLPEQFLPEYDYDFVFHLKTRLIQFRHMAKNNVPIVAHSVLEELMMYLIIQEAEMLMESMQSEMEAYGIEDLDMWDEWIFDLFDDMDIITFLYSDMYVPNTVGYHFEHWTEDQFYCN